MTQTIDPFPGHYDASDPFGNAEPPRTYGHTGSDWGNGIGGESIPAIAAGEVVFAGWEPTGGNGYCVCIAIDGGLYVAYLHQARDPFVAVGERVALGEHVGVVGGTGTNARGPHLHITISDSPRAYQGLGNKIDPWQFIQDHLATLAATEGEDDMLEFMAEMPIQPPGRPEYKNPGALTEDGSKHTFFVVPSKHLFWHVQNNGQLVFYRDGLGVRHIPDQGADIMLGFDLLGVGESV